MELLERFAQGHIDAFETLLRQVHPDVYGWIVRIVRDPGVGEDLTVETFCRIHWAHARFNPMGNFSGGPDESRQTLPSITFGVIDGRLSFPMIFRKQCRVTRLCSKTLAGKFESRFVNKRRSFEL